MAYFQLSILFLVTVLMLDRLLGGDPVAQAIKFVSALVTLIFAIFGILQILAGFNPFRFR